MKFELEDIDKLHRVILDSTGHPEETIESSRPLRAQIVKDGAAKIKATHVYLNATDYADIRTADRDSLEIEVQAVLLKKGLMAHLDDIMVFIHRDIGVGEIRFMRCNELDYSVVFQLNIKYPKDLMDGNE